MTVILIHDNVMLRPMKESDIKRLWNLTTPELFTHMLNLIQTIEEFEKWMRTSYEQMRHSETSTVFVVAHLETDELYGSTRIYNIDYANKACEIGATYYGKAFQRTHINTKAKWLLLTYAFETLGMIRVEFKTDEENLISQKAIERLGAIKEGVIRNERIRSTGKARNAVLYSIISSEWPSIKKKLENRMNIYSQ
ncbi:GNAT family N-acetyltransferase [Paenisporosarcina antarctica]|uniref:GNAT family N-acetyltransferase n=1 Tax=Paenisporosarcina antarctica TaxID=417367 RepID=UPI001AB047F6|nr:GNAT family protein [Paenisporosarcina antarctica]